MLRTMVILGIYVVTLYYIGTFSNQVTQNIHAFSVCEIFEPMLVIVYNLI